MRRLLLVGMLIVACGLAATQALRSEATTDGSVDVIFDTAKGLVPGQAVKVVGEPVGTIGAVHLEAERDGTYRARLTLKVDQRFLPFHSDVRCRILPQGLLSENYVDCDPGSPDRPPLDAGPSGRPTVPVSRTTVPLGLQDVLNTFNLPTSERLGVLISQLGAGVAGRGQNLRGIVRRAFPALDQTDHTLSIIAGQRLALRQAIGSSDQVLTELARRDRDISRFVDHAATVTETTAGRRRELSKAIRRLPATLDALRRVTPSVRRVAEQGTPLLAALRRSAPALNGFVGAFDRFARPAGPALAAATTASDSGRTALGPAAPVIRAVRTLAKRSGPLATSLDRTLSSFRQTGGMDRVLGFFTALAAGAGPYDKTGHLFPVVVGINPRCILASTQPGTATEPGCSHAYSAPGYGQQPLTQTAPGTSGRSTPISKASLTSFLDYLLG